MQMGFSQQWIIWHWCCRKRGWAHLGVPAPAELQDHDLQGQTAMGKSNVCKYSVPEGPHQQEKQPPALSLSLDWLHSFSWEQNIGNTPTAPGFGKSPFPISNSQLPNWAFIAYYLWKQEYPENHPKALPSTAAQPALLQKIPELWKLY